MRQARVYPDRLRWMPNYIDVASIEPKAAPGGDVVYVGRLSEEKGVDVLVEAVARSRSLRASVVGDGPARGSLERLTDELGVGDRVRFLGRLPAAGVLDALRAAAVAVVPSRWYENMPIAVLEAFAAGVPVVGTDLGGLPELIDAGRHGMLVPPDDPLALADALESFTADPERAHGMGAAARASVEERFAPAAHLERLATMYAEAGAGAAAR
jgi:glycosyltransferase involved in cell wall biosynthesis